MFDHFTVLNVVKQTFFVNFSTRRSFSFLWRSTRGSSETSLRTTKGGGVTNRKALNHRTKILLLLKQALKATLKLHMILPNTAKRRFLIKLERKLHWLSVFPLLVSCAYIVENAELTSSRCLYEDALTRKFSD